MGWRVDGWTERGSGDTEGAIRMTGAAGRRQIGFKRPGVDLVCVKRLCIGQQLTCVYVAHQRTCCLHLIGLHMQEYCGLAPSALLLLNGLLESIADCECTKQHEQLMGEQGKPPTERLSGTFSSCVCCLGRLQWGQPASLEEFAHMLCMLCSPFAKTMAWPGSRCLTSPLNLISTATSERTSEP